METLRPLLSRRCRAAACVLVCVGSSGWAQDAWAQARGAWAPSVYRDVKSVTVVAQAEATAAGHAELCHNFNLTRALVQRVLREATEVDVRAYAHDLDVAPCQSRGRLQLANGLEGSWTINMAGSAVVEFEDGRQMLLHCRFCGKPFTR